MMEILLGIFEICIIPLLAFLTTKLVQFLNIKKNEVQAKVDNDLADKYIAFLFDTITNAVIATNQTYVESLKKQGKFDAEAQKRAFQKTFDAVKATITEDMAAGLREVVQDLDQFISIAIEAIVNRTK